MLLAHDKQELLEAELDASENLLWAGRPDPFQAARAMIGISVAGVFWLGMTVAGIATGWQYVTVDLFLIPFLLIGLGLLSAPGWVYLFAANTVYAITSKRVLIIKVFKAGRSREVESYARSDLGTIKRVEHADRSGTLTFAQRGYNDSDGDKHMKEIQFVGIPAVRDVEFLLREALTGGGY